MGKFTSLEETLPIPKYLLISNNYIIRGLALFDWPRNTGHLTTSHATPSNLYSNAKQPKATGIVNFLRRSRRISLSAQVFCLATRLPESTPLLCAFGCRNPREAYLGLPNIHLMAPLQAATQ